MVQCRLGLWFLLALSILILAPTQAGAEWLVLESRYQSHPLQTAYIDPDTIYRDGDLVSLSALIDWKAMQGGRTPTRFYSTTLIKQVDCAARTVQTIAATDFYGHMATGEVIGGGRYANGDQWVAIRQGTINEGLWETGCKKG
jgi:hypothetical protein